MYWERVATVREIEVLCTELLDKDPYLIRRWQTLWASSRIREKFKGRACPLLGLLRNMKARAGQEILRAAICRV